MVRKILLVVFLFIVFDVITGIIKALYKEGINSTSLRHGLYHKLSELLCVIGALLLEYGVKYVELPITIPALGVTAAYICTMELVSIVENLCEINPSFKKFFEPYLQKLK